jgi:NB-ARC domain
VHQKFPNVEPELAKTLGKTGWNRRVHMMSISKAPAVSKPVPPATRSEVSFDEFNRPGATRSSVKHTSELDTLDQTSTTSASHSKAPPKSSVQPKSFGDITVQTSVVDNRSEAELTRLGRLHLPCPPNKNHSFDGEPFECPYCLKTLCGVTNSRIWRYHVMTDLEPYMCTFKGCKSPDRTYRTKQEWFQHELKEHLLPKYWNCPMCEKRTDNRDIFKEHLRTAHEEEYPEPSIQNVIDTCESQPARQLENIKCPLCKKICENDEKWFNHVGDELEQLALFALGPDSQLQTLEDDVRGLSHEDQNKISHIFSPGIIEGLAIREDRPQIVEQILKQQEEDAKRPKTTQGELDGNEGDKTTFVRELLLTRQPRKRFAACTFPVTTITTARDPDFFQRSVSQVKKIHETLLDPGRNVCVIHGPGGVGKTLLGLEYAHEFESAYDASFWLHLETETGILESMRHIAETLQLGLDGTEDDIEIVEIAKEWMRETGKLCLTLVLSSKTK